MRHGSRPGVGRSVGAADAHRRAALERHGGATRAPARDAGLGGGRDAAARPQVQRLPAHRLDRDPLRHSREHRQPHRRALRPRRSGRRRLAGRPQPPIRPRQGRVLQRRIRGRNDRARCSAHHQGGRRSAAVRSPGSAARVRPHDHDRHRPGQRRAGMVPAAHRQAARLSRPDRRRHARARRLLDQCSRPRSDSGWCVRPGSTGSIRWSPRWSASTCCGPASAWCAMPPVACSTKRTPGCSNASLQAINTNLVPGVIRVHSLRASAPAASRTSKRTSSCPSSGQSRRRTTSAPRSSIASRRSLGIEGEHAAAHRPLPPAALRQLRRRPMSDPRRSPSPAAAGSPSTKP